MLGHSYTQIDVQNLTNNRFSTMLLFMSHPAALGGSRSGDARDCGGVRVPPQKSVGYTSPSHKKNVLISSWVSLETPVFRNYVTKDLTHRGMTSYLRGAMAARHIYMTEEETEYFIGNNKKSN